MDAILQYQRQVQDAPFAYQQAPVNASRLDHAVAFQQYAVGVQTALYFSRKSRSEGTHHQRARAQNSFTAFLHTAPAAWLKSWYTATDIDVTQFFTSVFLPEHGRTRLANGEVLPSHSYLNSTLSHLSTAFQTIGRVGAWDSTVDKSKANPCTAGKTFP